MNSGRNGQKISKKSVKFNYEETMMTALTDFWQMLRVSLYCQKKHWTLFTQSSVHVLLHRNKFSHNLSVKRKREKKEPIKKIKNTFFPSGQKACKCFNSHRINKTVNSLTKQCVPLDQLEHLSFSFSYFQTCFFWFCSNCCFSLSSCLCSASKEANSCSALSSGNLFNNM